MSAFTKLSRAPAFLVFLIAIHSVGCGEGGQTSRASGKATLGGKAIESGSILFVPIDDTPGGTAGATITAGSYSVPRGLVPGTYRVELRSPRPSTKLIPKPFSPPGEMIQAMEEAVAADFNDRSMLLITLNAGANTVDIEVLPRAADDGAD